MTESDQKYQATLDFLYSFVDYSLTRQLRYSPEKFNLDRMRRLMRIRTKIIPSFTWRGRREKAPRQQ